MSNGVVITSTSNRVVTHVVVYRNRGNERWLARWCGSYDLAVKVAKQLARQRLNKAHGRRVADADPEDLAGLLGLHDVVEDAITVAIDGQRSAGFSWADIGRGLGTSRQNAFQRYGRRVMS